MDIQIDNLSTAKPSSFAETHCQNCGLGWTRRSESGGLLIVCLLDRQPTWFGMTDCDRFERKEPA